MNYIYVSAACLDEKYRELLEKGIINSGQQSQKFNNLLIKGLGSWRDVTAISVIPVSMDCAQKVIERDEEATGRIKYISTKIINLRIIRNLTNVFFLVRELMKEIARRPDSVIICDAYSVSCSIAATLVSRLRHIKRIAVVTDLPQFLRVNSMLGKIVFYLMRRYDRYILLTKPMSRLVNVKAKPEIVVEGSCDEKMAEFENDIAEKANPKTLVFTGSLTAHVGIEEMIQAFVECNRTDYELRIFGSGELSDKIMEYAKDYPNVKYFGQVDNARAVNEQIVATLLLNPRFSDGEYTKYSFPSKIIEYMASGTPVLTTALTGIPNEYYEYMYVFEQENLTGYQDAITRVLEKEPEELHLQGKRAKEFVIANKTNVMQTKRIVEWVEGN